MNIEHYAEQDNKRKKETIDFILSHNSEFEEFDISVVEQCNKWLVDDGTEVEGREAVQIYYEELCDELIVITKDDSVVACRFVEFDRENTFFRSRVDEYKPGLNLTFALVDKEYRNKGLWSMMFDYVVEEILPKYPVNKMYLVTSSENIPMQKVAEKTGFNKISIEEDGRSEGIDNIVYRFG